MDEEEDVSLSSMEMETEKRPLPLYCIDIMDYLWYIYYVLISSVYVPMQCFRLCLSGQHKTVETAVHAHAIPLKQDLHIRKATL